MTVTPEPEPTDATGDPDAAPLPGWEEFRRLLDEVEKEHRAIAAATARRAESLDRLRRCSDELVESHPLDTTSTSGWTAEVCAERELLLELVGVLKMPENTVRNLLSESKDLVQRLPATLDAMHDGAISYQHARVIVDHVTSVPPSLQVAFERSLLDHAAELTVQKLKRVAVREREALFPDSITERHTAALDTRTVWIESGDDGMCTIGAKLSAEVATGIFDRLTTIALGAPASDRRGLAQKRADAFADLLLIGDTCDATADGDGGGRPDVGHGIRPKVLVTVPVMTLLGASELPGNLDGYGPIDPATARELAAAAPSFTRLLVHPVSSAILDFDRTTYAVPADLKTVLRVRDATCRQIGCERRATASDLDHGVEWKDGGVTALDNLAYQCPPHHRVKTHTRVRLRNLPGGDLEWTFPSGRVHVTHPENPIDQLKRAS